MPLPRIALLFLVLAAPVHAADEPAKSAGNLEYSIKGLKSDLEAAVRSGLTLQQYNDRTVSEAQLRRLLSVGQSEVTATLEAWGYYDGKVASGMEKTAEGGFRAWFDVEPGDACAFSLEPRDDRRADAARGTCHERYVAAQFVQCRSPRASGTIRTSG